MERRHSKSHPSYEEKRAVRRNALDVGFDIITRNQDTFTPQETEQLTTHLLSQFALGEVTDMVDHYINPEKITKIIFEDRITKPKKQSWFQRFRNLLRH